ncbi:hypothetical protein H1R13_34365 [Streptomyces mexicanus]|uniref:Lipoprotein n=2 Tax=Streptomyces mexicanus TaxID=178566 RepID=A0A7X1LU51_9ACTN|nr:hypothetical protein [Streptomyces mexicanus]
MRLKLVITLAAAGLLATGCGGGKSDSSDADAKVSAPAKVTMTQRLTDPGSSPDPEPSPSPADSAPFNEQVAYELQKRTLKMAHAPGKTTGECPKGLSSKEGTKATCTTTYEGLKVQWKVTVGDKAAWSFSGDYVTFDATPSTGIITRDGVARLLFGNFSPEYVLCNNIPKATLAPLNVASKYSCEPVYKGDKPHGYGTPVRATEDGPRSY